ncbi:amino acid adenylation domain protein (plasmid) [Gemmatirosa kalamazoonensis]|uniref:Amino acid adenylation domain protein n=1 Tax=Gemmatirosa kalamazoonensis TaxID=861299 RepID=W0RSZ3_9BACT|nr:amino acid adenylation domain protein [Gemmatirosa kalamazoonensis]
MTHHSAGDAPDRFDDDLDLLADLLDAEGIDASAGAGIPRRAPDAPVPMSFSQELLWLLDRATPGMTAYNLMVSRRLRGALDVAALERALSLLAARHESLRVRFADVDGEHRLLVDPPAPVALDVVDLSGAAWPEREAERVSRERGRRPFDLAKEHLFRATLLVLGPADHVLLLESHHIVLDGWSLGILLRELAPAYAAFRGGREASLPEVPVQFGDFAAWQRAQLSGERLEKLLAFWRAQLGEATEPLALPTDRPRAAVPTFAGARATATLSADTLAAVRALAQRHDATLYMVLLAAYATVLHRYTGRANVLIGSGSAGRSARELESVVGYLNNTLVQRADFTGDPTFAELLGRVRASALGAYDHQEVPLEKLVLELRQGQERLADAPLFEVVLTMQDTGASTALALDGVTVEPFGVDMAATKFDLTLLVSERADGLQLVAQYRSELFEPATIQRFLGHLATVLESAAADATQRVSRMPLATAAERAELAAWNETAADEGAPATLVALFEAQAARVPERTAVVGADAALSYAQLNARANALAGQLRSLGVTPNAPVGLLLDRSAEAIVGLFGILKAGGAYMPLSVEAPGARLATQLTESGAKVVVTDAAGAGKLPASVQAVTLDSLGALSGASIEPTATPDDLAYVLYTSGSTGTPKGVAVTHANAVHYARAISRVLGTLDGLQFGMVSTLAADLGNTALLPSLIAGGTLHVLSKDVTTDPARFAEYVAAHPLDVIKATPNHAQALGALPRQWLVVGGEALRPEVARTFLNAGTCRVLNHYGPTETTVGVLTHEVTTASLSGQTVPLGKPLANTHAYVVDTFGNEQPVGIPGELLIGGAGVARGYLNRDDLTAERFVAFHGERVYRTGDRVRRLPDGSIEFLGRVDDQVKVRGFRVELGEIEQVLRANPGVAQAVVVLNEEELVAYAVPKQAGYAVSHSDRPTREKLVEWLAAQLPEYMVPSAVVLLDALPLTPNGKVDKRALPAPDASAAAADTYVAPRTPTEEQLATIWAEVLKKERVGVTDNFMDLGGHSLMAIRVLGRISKTFGVRLALRTLFETPTVEQLAARIDAERGAGTPPAGPSGGIGSVSRDAYRIGKPAPAGPPPPARATEECRCPVPRSTRTPRRRSPRPARPSCSRRRSPRSCCGSPTAPRPATSPTTSRARGVSAARSTSTRCIARSTRSSRATRSCAPRTRRTTTRRCR